MIFKIPGMFFAPDGDDTGGDSGDSGDSGKAAAESTAKAQKTADAALAAATATQETIQQMSKNLEGLNAQLGHGKRKNEGEIPEGMHKQTFEMLGAIKTGLTEMTGKLEGQQKRLDANDITTVRKNIQEKFKIADGDMGFLQGSSLQELTESATALIKRFNNASAEPSARPNAPLPTHGGSPDGSAPDGPTPAPPLVKGEAVKRAADMAQDFQKGLSR